MSVRNDTNKVMIGRPLPIVEFGNGDGNAPQIAALITVSLITIVGKIVDNNGP